MHQRGSSPTCVFCGRPVEEGQLTTGRGDSLAHADCADRALADDAHWDRIADQVGERRQEPNEQPAGARKSGCLTLVLPLAVALLAVALLVAALS
jgi:hypothetical protein